MKIINLNTGEGVKFLTFPDGQPHAILEDIGDEFMAQVICSITTSKVLVHLGLVAEVLNRRQIYWELHIPYLLGARYDRVMEDDNGDLKENDSFDLAFIAKYINEMLDPAIVYLYDVHSDVSTALIKNSRSASNKALVQAYDKEKAILIIPDAGAAKKAAKYLKWNPNIIDTVNCVKHRDPDGKVHLKVLEPEKCKGENCVIIDDICDGGRTFNAIAEQIDPLHLTLIVTHGIFSAGMQELDGNFDQIITSNSYPAIHKGMESKVKIIDHVV